MDSFLKQIATYLNVPLGKIVEKDNSLPVYVDGENRISGFLNIILEYLKQSNQPLNGSNNEEKSQIRQWIEYGLIYVLSRAKCSNEAIQILEGLNSILSIRTFLVAHKFTIAHQLLYYILYKIVQNLPVIQKEKYVHLCRWFDNLQQNPLIRQSNKLVNFKTNYLSVLAPSKY